MALAILSRTQLPRQSLRFTLKRLQTFRTMKIESIPMWTGSSDNYAYLVIDDKTKDAFVIDPAHPAEVLPVLEQRTQDKSINFKGIINTHHHWDHSGGNDQILEKYPGIRVIGGEKCQSKTETPTHGESFGIGEAIKVKALHTPCHTQDSICYFMQEGDEKVVFTGDTLFIGGCGRFFEGTAEEMHHALNGVLGKLPDDTKVYPGHEYTKSNVSFCKSVLDTLHIQQLQQFCEHNKETQGKFTIGDEKNHNVFMMVDDPRIQQATGKTDPVDAMAKLREMKNSFK